MDCLIVIFATGTLLVGNVDNSSALVERLLSMLRSLQAKIDAQDYYIS